MRRQGRRERRWVADVAAEVMWPTFAAPERGDSKGQAARAAALWFPPGAAPPPMVSEASAEARAVVLRRWATTMRPR
jgi:hypothetical protein